MKVIEVLRQEFGNHFDLVEKRPNIQQIVAPLYHEDGDMLDIFLDIPKGADLLPKQKIVITDHGLTLMRLSYSFELDTPNKERIFQRILTENGIAEEDGKLRLETTPESLYPALMQFAQTIAKVCNMRQFKREVLASLFEEMLDSFIEENLPAFKPQKAVFPLPNRDDLEVDWQFRTNGNSVPQFLFSVKGNSQARLAAIACLEFQKAKLPFKSIVVHEDFERLSKKDRMRVTSASDKQFPSLEDFQQNITTYLERERMH